MVCGAKEARSSLNMDTLDHSEDEEEQGRCATISGSRSGSRFGARRLKRRPGGSHQHLLLMDCVSGGGGGGDGEGASEETVPLPDYERLSQSARLPDDPDDDDSAKNPPPAPLAAVELQQQKAAASPPPPPPLPPQPTQQQQKPAAWRLIEYVRSRNKSGGAPTGGCGAGSDGDSKSSEDGEDGGEDGKKDKSKKKKRSSWLPDPDRRWPVQGFY